MTFGCIGTVVNVQLDQVSIKDFSTNQVFVGKLSKSDLFELKVGMQGYFSGDIKVINGTLQLGNVNRVDETKLLEPLNEQDVYLSSGQFTLLDAITDPFFEFFRKYENQPYYDPNVEVIDDSE